MMKKGRILLTAGMLLGILHFSGMRVWEAPVYQQMTGALQETEKEALLTKGQETESELSTEETETAETENFVDPVDQKKTEELLSQVRTELLSAEEAAGETWCIDLMDLTTGAFAGYQGDLQMPSASVIKVFLMATIYDRVCYPASEERHISIAESYEGELRQLINAMITVSDNDASNTLLTKLGGGDAYAGMQIVNQFCEENGYTGTHFGRKFLESNPSDDNYTCADDCTRLLASIYNGTCVNAEASAKMYAFLLNQTRTWKIPAGLSGTGAITANKTGELGGEYGCYVENDIAIIDAGETVYVLSILTNHLQNTGAAQYKIQNISSAIYQGLVNAN